MTRGDVEWSERASNFSVACDSENGFLKRQFTTVNRVLRSKIRDEAAKISQKWDEPLIIMGGGVSGTYFFFHSNEVCKVALGSSAIPW